MTPIELESTIIKTKIGSDMMPTMVLRDTYKIPTPRGSSRRRKS